MTLPSDIPPPLPGQRSWWGRNWKWCVPAIVLAATTIFVLLVMLVIGGIFRVMKSSDVYVNARDLAAADATVREELGTPIKEGFMVSGNIRMSGGGGYANLSFPLTGPKGKATVYTVATREAGQWNYTTLVVDLHASKQRIDLLNHEKTEP